MIVWRTLIKPRGDHRWDLFLRATGLAGVIGIPIAILFPQAAPLVWLAMVGVPANSPLSPILPTLFDPLIIEVGKYAPALAVTLVALGVYMYTEFVNWHIYKWALTWNRLATVRKNRMVRWGVDRFGRFPATTVVFFAVTPMPFWVVRCLAILREYPIGPFMMATAIGRFPRFFVYASVASVLSVPTWAIVAVIVGGAAVAIGSRLLKHQPLLADAILDGVGDSGAGNDSTPFPAAEPLSATGDSPSPKGSSAA